MAGIKIGNLDISKAYFGNLPVDKIYLGNVEVYSAMQQLLAPTISLSGNTLSIEEIENAEYYDIYVDGVLEESIDVRPTYNVSFVCPNGESKINYKSYFRIYDGQDNTGTLLFESVGQVAITFPINVECKTGYLFVEIEGSMVSYYTTASAGITPTTVSSDLSYQWNQIYTIANNGTITIGDLDYDD